MSFFKKESLELLKQRINLVELLEGHMPLKRSGAAFKGLCPFHDEKTPSFVVQQGDSHYHCFGCGAHGDAIHFLMTHQRMSFSEAVESLAQRFGVVLEKDEGKQEEAGHAKIALKNALEKAAPFYHFCLLHTAEGHEALHYLYQRGIDLEFIRLFQVGWAPTHSGIFRKAMETEGIPLQTLYEAGLVTEGKEGRPRDFFFDRILFPIQDSIGSVIGFSGRRWKEGGGGGKYVNTPETLLFKKSRVLFGLHHSRRRIAKERRALIVEGQIDALRLIQEGFNFTVAGQGTAFGEEQAKELLKLGVKQVMLALDSDPAGREAAIKIGNLFQKEGVEVRVVQLPPGRDPDLFLREEGPEAFKMVLENAQEYLAFLVQHLSSQALSNSPAAKNEWIRSAVKQIQSWQDPLFVHESLRRLAHLAAVPEQFVGVGAEFVPQTYFKRAQSVAFDPIDADKILETDLLRWLLLLGMERPQLHSLIESQLCVSDFHSAPCRKIFELYYSRSRTGEPCDLLSLVIALEDPEAEELLAQLSQKKINKQKAEAQVLETIQKILDRNWMEKREAIKAKIQSGLCGDEEVLALLKEFDALKTRA